MQTLLAKIAALQSQDSGKGKGKADSFLPKLPPIQFFLMFDEISKIACCDDDGRLYAALRRVLRALSQYKVWTFVLSTRSPLHHITPQASLDPSARIESGELERITPYYSFPLDVGAHSHFASGVAASEGTASEGAVTEGAASAAGAVELVSTMTGVTNRTAQRLDQLASAAHMTLYGRPLWLAHRDSPCQILRSFALRKLLCSSSFNTRDHQQVFAVLSSRLCLDPCTKNEGTVEFSEQAVNNHLRIILALDNTGSRIATTTPAEPVVAEAAAYLMVEDGSRDLWGGAICTLVASLLQPGLVDKGRAGELVARTLLTMAHDDAAHANSSPNSEFKYARPIKVTAFLDHLFTKEIYNAIYNSQPEAFKIHGWINFTHFTQTDQKICPCDMQELLHNLIYSQCALQLSPVQPVWDLLVPVYYGEIDKPFDIRKLSAIFFQVKNRVSKSHLFLSESDYRPFFPEQAIMESQLPVLSILLDLGVGNVPVPMTLAHLDQPRVYGWHIQGSGQETFSCVSKGSRAQEIKKLMSNTVDVGPDTQLTMSNYNMRYRRHNWAERFPVSGKDVPDGSDNNPKIDVEEAVGDDGNSRDAEGKINVHDVGSGSANPVQGSQTRTEGTRGRARKRGRQRSPSASTAPLRRSKRRKSGSA